MESHDIPFDEFEKLRQATEEVHDVIKDYLNEWNTKGRPVAGSQLDRECQQSVNPEAIITAYDHGVFLNDLVANQLIAITRALAMPYLGLASWTILRTLLESSTISAWLLDPRCNAVDRVQRSFCHRYAGLIEQKKFASSANSPHADPIQADKAIDKLLTEANTVGVPVGRDKRRKICWVGMPKPSSTEIIEQVYGESFYYRLLSSYVHGYHWASITLSYKAIDDGSGDTARLVQKVSPFILTGVPIKAFLWFAKPVWYRCKLNGFDLEALKKILDQHANRSIGVAKGVRFWDIEN